MAQRRSARCGEEEGKKAHLQDRERPKQATAQPEERDASPKEASHPEDAG